MSFDECVTFPNGQQVGDLNETGDTKSSIYLREQSCNTINNANLSR